jgi:hypothetical protein
MSTLGPAALRMTGLLLSEPKKLMTKARLKELNKLFV